MRKLTTSLLALVAIFFVSQAKADFTAKDASLATITFKNPGTCTAVVCVPVVQLYDGTNTVTLTTAGANGASNTLTGVPTYARSHVFNGTTWDRWTGAVTVASGGIASGAIASGAMVDIGAQADAVCGSATGTCSLISLMKYLNNAANSAIPAGTNVIGKTGIDQTTDGTTNLAAIGAQAGSSGATTRLIQCDSKAIYDASTSGSTELVALSSGKTIYVCGYSIMGGGTVNVKLIYGTGTACATGSNNMTPAWQLTAQAGIVDKSPFYSGLKTAASNALCINASGAVAAQAIVYYAQF